MARILNPPIPSLVAIRDSAERTRRRRTWNRGFNPIAMRQYEPIVHKRVIQLLETLSQRGRVDLAEMFGYFAFVFYSSFKSFVDLFPIRFDVMADMASVSISSPQRNYPLSTDL